MNDYYSGYDIDEIYDELSEDENLEEEFND